MTAVPSLPSTVSAGGKIKATDFNLLINYLVFQRNPPRFKGSIQTATALTAGVAIKPPSIVDTASGYNVSTGQYTFQYPGTYALAVQWKWGNVTPGSLSTSILINGTSRLVSVNAPNAVFGGPVLNSDLVVVAGDILTCTVSVGFTTQVDTGADNNFLTLKWTGS